MTSQIDGLINRRYIINGEVLPMNKGIVLSLSVMLIVVISVLLLGLFGVPCQLWSQVALSGSKKIATRLIIRIVSELKISHQLPEIVSGQLHFFH